MDLLIQILAIGTPTLFSLVAYIMRTEKQAMLDRITKLENKAEDTVTKSEIRQILNDNIIPLKEDIIEIKDILRRILLNGQIK